MRVGGVSQGERWRIGGPSIANCGLCGQQRELARSHALPRALYRLCRADGATNPNPVLVTEEFQQPSPHQYADYFLCQPCEQRFSSLGERWVMAHCFRGKNKFLLRARLLSVVPIAEGEGLTAYSGASTDEVDVSALCYFPVSVFWRCAARSWNIRRHTSPPLKLGPYQEPIRRFLLGEEPFPSNCSLMVFVCLADVPFLATHFPMSYRTESCIEHRFYIPGIEFRLCISKQLTEAELRMGITTGANSPIFASHDIRNILRQRFSEGIGRRRLPSK
jgi:hypothetical protein